MTAPPTFKPDDIELIPDAWGRFERAVDTVSKSGPLPKREKRFNELTLVDRTRLLAGEVAALRASLAALPVVRPHSED
jgi:hypothetical protein